MFFVCLAASSTPPLLLEVNCVFWNVDVASYIPVPACWRSYRWPPGECDSPGMLGAKEKGRAMKRRRRGRRRKLTTLCRPQPLLHIRKPKDCIARFHHRHHQLHPPTHPPHHQIAVLSSYFSPLPFSAQSSRPRTMPSSGERAFPLTNAGPES